MIDLLLELLPALTIAALGGLLATWIHLANHPDKHLEQWAARLGWFSLALYFFWIVLLTFDQGQIPFISVGQLAALLGFLIWASHLYIQRKIRQGILVVLPVIASVIMILLSIILGFQSSERPAIFEGPWVAFHIGFTMAGVALILGAGVYGIGYMVLYRQIKNRKFGPLYSFLPSLGDLNNLRTLTLLSGWLFITLGMIAGSIWMGMRFDIFALFKGHLGIALLFWVIISAMSAAARFKWLGQHQLAGLSVLLSAVIVVLIIISIVVTYPGGAL